MDKLNLDNCDAVAIYDSNNEVFCWAPVSDRNSHRIVVNGTQFSPKTGKKFKSQPLSGGVFCNHYYNEKLERVSLPYSELAAYIEPFDMSLLKTITENPIVSFDTLSYFNKSNLIKAMEDIPDDTDIISVKYDSNDEDVICFEFDEISRLETLDEYTQRNYIDFKKEAAFKLNEKTKIMEELDNMEKKRNDLKKKLSRYTI